MHKLMLNKDWQVTYEELDRGPELSPLILKKNSGWLQADLPCDIHMPLIESGIIKEPLEKDHFQDCIWTETKSWWFKKSFIIDQLFLEGDVIELTLESLDSEGDIFLNGLHIGHQKSAFYPFVMNVKKYLQEGENTLLVRLTSGIEHISDQDMGSLKRYISTETKAGRGDRGDARRAFVRKPQYVYGWDWGPRVATCGIVKEVYLNSYKQFAIRNVYAQTSDISTIDIENEVTAELLFEIEIENFNETATMDVDLAVEIYEEQPGNPLKKIIEVQLKDQLLRSGKNYFTLKTHIQSAKLWWPNGMGDQNLYTIKVSAESRSYQYWYPDFNFGIRTLAVDQEKRSNNGRRFQFVINGKPVFCKGANYIPADSIYARVDDNTYDQLIGEAKTANFNMLRIWGGGLYEKDLFYNLCDKYGILIWHDFMFACALYPDYDEAFLKDVEKEMMYQTTRLRNHAAMALWCGNNEIHWGYDEWWVGDNKPEKFSGSLCYNQLAPQIVRKNCPHIPYWNSSPYGGEHPNGNEAGDRHHWGDCMMNEQMEKRIDPGEYDKITASFISEYGYVGPCKKSSMIKYHGDTPMERGSRIWQLHNNTFEKDTVEAGIKKHYADPENLDLESYLLYAGLCQGLMLGYSLEAIRFKTFCGGALFWMYNDCWGEVGWTIIDYYLTRKTSYYFVKRAFARQRLMMRERDNKIHVFGANDSQNAISFKLEYGYMTLDGSFIDSKIVDVVIADHSREGLLDFEKGDFNIHKGNQQGVFFARPVGDCEALPAILCSGDYRKWQLPDAKVRIVDIEQEGTDWVCRVQSDTYAHAVHFDLPDSVKLSDNFFDLLPGEVREIRVLDVAKTIGAENIQPQCVNEWMNR